MAVREAPAPGLNVLVLGNSDTAGLFSAGET